MGQARLLKRVRICRNKDSKVKGSSIFFFFFFFHLSLSMCMHTYVWCMCMDECFAGLWGTCAGMRLYLWRPKVDVRIISVALPPSSLRWCLSTNSGSTNVASPVNHLVQSIPRFSLRGKNYRRATTPTRQLCEFWRPEFWSSRFRSNCWAISEPINNILILR